MTSRKPRATSKRVVDEPARLMVEIDAVRPDPNNARQRTPRNLETLKASLDKFGQQRAIVVDADGVILAGNGTHLAAKSLGWSTIWVTRSDLSGAEARAYAIADNRTTDLSQFDEGLLAEQLADLDVGLLVATGFDELEIEELTPIEQGEAGAAGPAPATKVTTGQKRVIMRLLVAVREVSIVERALRATGIASREKALTEISNVYLAQKGEINVSETPETPPVGTEVVLTGPVDT